MDEFIDLTYSTTPGPSTSVQPTVDEIVSLLTPEGSPIHEPNPPVIQTQPPIGPVPNKTDPVEVIGRPTGKSGSTEIRLELSQSLLQEDEVGSGLLRKLQETGSNGFVQSDPQSALQKSRRFILWQQWSRDSKKSEMKFQFRYSYVLYIFKNSEFVDELLYDGLGSFLTEVQSLWPSMGIAVMVIGPKQDLLRKSDFTQKLMKVLLRFKGVSFHSFEQIKVAIEHVLYLTAIFEKPAPFKEQNKFLSVFGGCKNSVGMKDVDLKLTLQSIESKELRNWINLLHTIPGVDPIDAHTVALHYPSFGALMESLVDPTKSYEEKIIDIASLTHLSEKRARVGKAAAKALFKFLTSIDSDTVL